MSRMGICKQCKKECKICARNLCRSCYVKEFQEEKRSQGICTHCRSRPIDFEKSTSLCSMCFEKGKIAYNRLKQQRLKDKCCVECGKYTGGSYRCESCNMRKRNYITHEYDMCEELRELQGYLEGRKKQ